MAFSHLTFILLLVFVQQLVGLPLENRVLINELSEENLKLLASWTPESNQSMWEISGQYQGDMILTVQQYNGMILNPEIYRWRTRDIPYEIDQAFYAHERLMIERALASQYRWTCISPRRKTSRDVDYIHITREPKGCFSHVGRQRGRQQLNLDSRGCLFPGTIAHEFLHALGFFHQHSAPERDNYVEIRWENIVKGMEENFRKFGSNVASSFGEKYDYGSLMHYEQYAFSVNGKRTIIPKDRKAFIGQRNGLSKIDIAKLEKMYGCRK